MQHIVSLGLLLDISLWNGVQIVQNFAIKILKQTVRDDFNKMSNRDLLFKQA